MYQSNLNDTVFFFLCQKPKRDWNQSCPCSYYVLSSPRLSLIPALNCLTLILAAKMIVKQRLQYHIKYSETHQSHSFQFLFEIHTVPQFCDFQYLLFQQLGIVKPDLGRHIREMHYYRLEIATHWSPMRPKLKRQPHMKNWSFLLSTL